MDLDSQCPGDFTKTLDLLASTLHEEGDSVATGSTTQSSEHNTKAEVLTSVGWYLLTCRFSCCLGKQFCIVHHFVILIVPKLCVYNYMYMR